MSLFPGSSLWLLNSVFLAEISWIVPVLEFLEKHSLQFVQLQPEYNVVSILWETGHGRVA